jgi:hypothetical protein
MEAASMGVVILSWNRDMISAGLRIGTSCHHRPFLFPLQGFGFPKRFQKL